MSPIEAISAQVATHEFHLVPPDEFHATFRGEFSELHAGPYLEFVSQCAERTGQKLYALYDLSTFTRATEGGRKRVINVERPYPFAALAVWGTSFTTRTVAGMILKAGKLVAPQSFQFPIKFLATKADAHAWFDELRKQNH